MITLTNARIKTLLWKSGPNDRQISCSLSVSFDYANKTSAERQLKSFVAVRACLNVKCLLILLSGYVFKCVLVSNLFSFPITL